DAIAQGLATARHPGRLELLGSAPVFLLDGAHNPAGAASLRDYLEEFGRRPLTMVFAAMRDKKLEQIGAILFPLADCLVLTTVDNPRAASLEMLRPIARSFARGSVFEAESSDAALQVAIEKTPPDGLVCVSGSLYLIG